MRSVTVMRGNGKFVVGGNWKCALGIHSFRRRRTRDRPSRMPFWARCNAHSPDRQAAASFASHSLCGRVASRSNGTRESVQKLVADLNAQPPTADVDIICAPTYLHLDRVSPLPVPVQPSRRPAAACDDAATPLVTPSHVRRAVTPSQVVSSLSDRYQVAAQNSWLEGPGAYTGEIAVEQILDMGAKWVILGHSERRALCGETSEVVGKKTKRALSKGCVAAIGRRCESPRRRESVDSWLNAPRLFSARRLKAIVCVGETLAQREGNQTMTVIYEQARRGPAQRVNASPLESRRRLSSFLLNMSDRR